MKETVGTRLKWTRRNAKLVLEIATDPTKVKLNKSPIGNSTNHQQISLLVTDDWHSSRVHTIIRGGP